MPEGGDLYRVLIVDSDALFREMLESSIRLHNPSCSVFSTAGPLEAQDALQHGLMDVAITDIDFGGSTQKGLLFLEQLLMQTAAEDILVVSAHPLKDCQGLISASQYLPKPPTMDELLRRIDRILRSHRDSILRGMTLPSILQVIQQDNKTCTLTVTSGANTGFLYCQSGRLVHGTCGTREGKSAVMEILSWPNVTTRITERCRAPQTISDSLTNLLLDWALETDHAASARA